jgi:hemerythrin
MPQKLTWRDEWAVSIEALDEDHRALVALLSKISGRYGAPDGQPSGESEAAPSLELVAELEKLGKQVRDHFRREEAFMRSIDYPGLANHQCEHALLMAEYGELVRGLKERYATHLDAAAMEYLNDWMVPQILGPDRAFADYYFRIIRDGEPRSEE